MATPVSNPVSVLPRYVGIKGDNGLYLALKEGGILTFDAPNITHLCAHEVLFNADEDTFVIRSSNQRFWRRDGQNWILADRASESSPPSNDTASRFKLAKLDNDSSGNKYAFQSASDGLYLNRLLRNNRHGYSALEKVPNLWSQVEVSDAGQEAIALPKYIFIKGDNSKYMHAHRERSIDWLKFHGDEPGNLHGISEVIPLIDGSLAFFSPQTQLCWRNTGGWVWTDTLINSAITNSRCHFEPIKLSSTIIALRSIFDRNRLCKRYTDYWTNCLACITDATTRDTTTHLTISDATISRNIFNVKYLLNLAFVSEERVLAVAQGSATNNSSFNIDLTVNAQISEQVSKSYTFTNSFTFTQSVSTEFKAGVPFLAEGKVKVEIGFEQSFSNEWGETTSREILFNTSYLVKDVPPGKTASVTVLCSSAKMRIPFTYNVRDTAPNNTYRPVRECIDGIFEGVDAYRIEAVISNSTTTETVPVQPSYGKLL